MYFTHFKLILPLHLKLKICICQISSIPINAFIDDWPQDFHNVVKSGIAHGSTPYPQRLAAWRGNSSPVCQRPAARRCGCTPTRTSILRPGTNRNPPLGRKQIQPKTNRDKDKRSISITSHRGLSPPHSVLLIRQNHCWS